MYGDGQRCLINTIAVAQEQCHTCEKQNKDSVWGKNYRQINVPNADDDKRTQR